MSLGPTQQLKTEIYKEQKKGLVESSRRYDSHSIQASHGYRVHAEAFLSLS